MIFNATFSFGQIILKKEDVATQFFVDSLLNTEFKNYKKIIINSILTNNYSDFFLYPACFNDKNIYVKIKSALLNKDTLTNTVLLSINLPNNLKKVILKNTHKVSKLKKLHFFIEVNRATFANPHYYVLIEVRSREYLYQYFFEISQENQILQWCKQEMIF
ncbi:hypothetical protein [Thermoflexibacter ruber]|uniref:hypothetical protein n=1 Tax=Thermoflexibacter ruber TaxID=1003 RepID=UPI0011607528|nr:hypothetical protein [Thermoflexibacter ruber]